LLLMRMDKQDITGTYITSQILKKFGRISYVILNMVPPNLAESPDLPSEVSGIIESTVIGVLPFYEEVLSHRSRGVFCLYHPQHPYSSQLLNMTKKFIQLTSAEGAIIDLKGINK
ncbi:MAG: hypothetical protein ACP5KV_05335, partial [Candidatus Methanomethylicaceae archaeon]